MSNTTDAQHDEANPVLALMRSEGWTTEDTLEWLKGFTEETTAEEWGPFREEHIDYARRILEGRAAR